MSQQGSTGNVIAALCSFFVPGLGQLIQGRFIMGVFLFVLSFITWFALMGWLVHLYATYNAAKFSARS